MKCLFCEIIKQKKNSYIIAENEKVLAILDIYPASDGHTLLISKSHFTNISEVDEESWKYFLPLLKLTINKLEKVFQPAGFNVITNMNEIAAQSVSHLHIHIIPKYKKNEGFIWTSKSKLKYNLEQVVEKLK
jgi:histidine triad (HIT) family protein